MAGPGELEKGFLGDEMAKVGDGGGAARGRSPVHSTIMGPDPLYVCRFFRSEILTGQRVRGWRRLGWLMKSAGKIWLRQDNLRQPQDNLSA